MIKDLTETGVHRIVEGAGSDVREGIRRRIILEQFIKARKVTVEEVSEQTDEQQITYRTFLSRDSDMNVVCEDVVVNPR